MVKIISLYTFTCIDTATVLIKQSNGVHACDLIDGSGYCRRIDVGPDLPYWLMIFSFINY